jgi:hypothetical protein
MGKSLESKRGGSVDGEKHRLALPSVTQESGMPEGHVPNEFLDWLIHIKGCDTCKRHLLTRELFERFLNEIYGEKDDA